MIALALASAIPAAGAAEQAEPVKSDNVKHLGQAQFLSGTELATSGKFLYAGQMDGGEGAHRGTAPEEGGMHIYDISKGAPKEVGFLHCPGNDNDVEVVKPGLVVLGFHTNKCAPQAGNGLVTVDVRNPRKPKILGWLNTGTNHTHKPYPGTNYVYTAGGDLPGVGPATGPQIVDVSDPKKPKIVGKLSTLTTDCHDISFSISKGAKLMFCAGAVGTGEVQIYDVSDPTAPVAVSRIFNPAIQYSHYAVASSDGQFLAIDDEAFGAHECATGNSPTGRVWIYNIENPQLPLLVGSFAPPRGGDTVPVGTYAGWVPSWCLSHGLDWQPGTHNVAVTWFTGGWSVVNADGTTPTEVAYFEAEDSQTYSALWANGRLYTNDSARGVDGFEVKTK